MEGLNIKCEGKTNFGKYEHPETHAIKVQNSFRKFEFCLEVIWMRITTENFKLDYEKGRKRGFLIANWP